MGILLKCRLWFCRSASDQKFCICNQLPGDANIAVCLLLFSVKAVKKKEKKRKEKKAKSEFISLLLKKKASLHKTNHLGNKIESMNEKLKKQRELSTWLWHKVSA